MPSPEDRLRESVAFLPGVFSHVGHGCFHLLGREERLFPAWLSGPDNTKL